MLPAQLTIVRPNGPNPMYTDNNPEFADLTLEKRVVGAREVLYTSNPIPLLSQGALVHKLGRVAEVGISHKPVDGNKSLSSLFRARFPWNTNAVAVAEDTNNVISGRDSKISLTINLTREQDVSPDEAEAFVVAVLAAFSDECQTALVSGTL